MNTFFTSALVVILGLFTTSMNRIDDVTAHATNASTHHAKAIMHAATLRDASGMSKADMQKHTSLTGEELTKAKSETKEAVKAMKPAAKEAPEAKVVLEHQQRATEAHQELTQETAKPKPDESLVKKLATTIHSELTKADENLKKVVKRI